MYKFFIERPIVSMVISIIMVIVGAVAVLGLPTAQFPNIADPQIQVNATYVGADALTVEQSVATPIEQQMSGVDNMEYMYSLNANNGTMKLTVDFNIKTDASTDQILAQMRQNQAASQLPAAVNNFGVTVQKSTAAPMMLFDLYSPNGTYDSQFLANYSFINLVDGLTQIPGIGSVSVFGAGQYAMRIWIKPDQLAKLQITVPDIINAVQTQNNVNPAGQIGGEPVPPGQEFTYAVRAQGRLVSEEEFGQIVVRAQSNGSLVRLKDVARIELGAQVYNIQGRLDGKPSAVIAVYQLPGSNAIAAAKGTTAFMENAKKRFPPGLDYVTALDTTLPVTEGIKEIEHTLLEALVLVILVVYIFLQGWRATLIPLLAVPVSLIGTFMVFPLLGFSVNTLSSVRPGAGHRLGCGRCDRRSGGCRTSHRTWAFAKRSFFEGYGRGVGSGDWYRRDSLRRVHSYRLHSGNHRTPLSAIRGNHRGFGDHLRVQRAHAQPCSLCLAASPQKGIARPARKVLWVVQQGVY